MNEQQVAELILGQSAAIRALRARILKVAPLDLSVLIQGPTGVGKELVAHALHAASGRPGSFVPFNVCAIAESMYEDALFGHVKGAFTGALRDAAGYLLEAHHGTAFFDEISGLALSAQAKLLRAIETKRFRPVGAKADRTSEFRVVSATNDDLPALAESGRFRVDLVQRLSGVVLRVPALKDRPDDIPLLAQHFLQQSAQRLRTCATLTMGAMRALQDYDWPGNVRELKHAVERALAFAATPTIGRDDVRATLGNVAEPRGRAGVDDDLARRELIALLEAVEWDTSLAAERLGKHKATLYRHMKRLAIVRPKGRGQAGPDPNGYAA